MRKHFIRNRKVRFGGIAAVLTALVIAVTVLANAIFSTLADRYGFSGGMLAILAAIVLLVLCAAANLALGKKRETVSH